MTALSRYGNPIAPSALDQLRQKAALSTGIETWQPTPGDVLEGVIVGSRKVSGPFGEQPQMLVQSPTGGVVAVWLNGWLLRQLRAQVADIGDLVSLTFHGRETSRTGAEVSPRITPQSPHWGRAPHGGWRPIGQPARRRRLTPR